VGWIFHNYKAVVVDTAIVAEVLHAFVVVVAAVVVAVVVVAAAGGAGKSAFVPNHEHYSHSS